MNTTIDSGVGCALRRLELRRCRIGETGAAALLEALQLNTSLMELRLDPTGSVPFVEALSVELCTAIDASLSRNTALRGLQSTIKINGVSVVCTAELLFLELQAEKWQKIGRRTGGQSTLPFLFAALLRANPTLESLRLGPLTGAAPVAREPSSDSGRVALARITSTLLDARVASVKVGEKHARIFEGRTSLSRNALRGIAVSSGPSPLSCMAIDHAHCASPFDIDPRLRHITVNPGWVGPAGISLEGFF